MLSDIQETSECADEMQGTSGNTALKLQPGTPGYELRVMC